MANISDKNDAETHHTRQIRCAKLGGSLLLIKHLAPEHKSELGSDYSLTVPVSDDGISSERNLDPLSRGNTFFYFNMEICSTKVPIEVELGEPTIDAALTVWRASEVFTTVIDATGIGERGPILDV